MASEPKWRQVAEDLRQKIESGELGGNKALPSEVELMGTYDASRYAVRDAIKSLTVAGLVVTRPRLGTFVMERIDPFVTHLSADPGTVGGKTATYESETQAYRPSKEAQSRRLAVSRPRVEIQQAEGLVAAELQLSAKVDVVCRSQERRIDDIPWSLQSSCYPFALWTAGAKLLLEARDLPDGVVQHIAETTGIRQAGWRERITARAPTRHETEFFNLPEDWRFGVIEIINTGFDQSKKPFRVTVTSYPADRNQFIMEVGLVPPLSTAP